MSRRVWRRGDPEPDDHPDIADSHGDVWRYELNDDAHQSPRCHCRDCQAPGGWWSPTVPHTQTLESWTSLFDSPHRGEDLTLSELEPGEFEEIGGTHSIYYEAEAFEEDAEMVVDEP